MERISGLSWFGHTRPTLLPPDTTGQGPGGTGARKGRVPLPVPASFCGRTGTVLAELGAGM